MTLNIKNFVKYIICLGVIYGALKISKCEPLSKKTTLIILVSTLAVMIVSDSLFKTESMSNIWEQASQLDNIDLSFDFSEDKDSKLNKLIQENSEEMEKELQLIKVTESESEKEMKANVSAGTVITTKGNASVTSLDKNGGKNMKSSAKASVNGKKIVAEESETIDEARSEGRREIRRTNSRDKDMELDLDEKTDCSVEIAKIKRKLESELRDVRKELMMSKEQINRNRYSQAYMNMLVKTLKKRGVIDKNDIDNLNAKLKSKLLTVADIIDSLERLMKNGKVKVVSETASKGEFDDAKKHNTMKYSERPTKHYEPIGKGVDKWSNDYTILNTEKWQIPMTRPPVCISSGNCKVCPTATEGYPVALKEWDNSRKVTNMKINKKWANDQMDTADEEILISEE